MTNNVTDTKVRAFARLFVFVLGLVPCVIALRAEISPTTVWAARAGGAFPDSAMAIVADATGNLYVAGTFGSTATFGAITLTAPQGKDLFLAKLSPTGEWLWAKDIEALVPGIYPCSMVIDSAGNPVVMTAIPGDLAGDGLNQLFVAKYSSTGTALWTKKFKPGGFSSVLSGGMTQDAANNLYITGTFGNQVNFGGITLTDSGNGDIFVLKLSGAGVTLAAKQFGQAGPVADQGKGVALDTAGNLYLAASFGGTIKFGTLSLTTSGSSDVAVVKFDPNLNVLWARQIGNVGEDNAFGLTRDAANNLLLLGSFSESTSFGTNRITPNIAGQLFITRVNGNGDFSWGAPAGPVTAAVSGSSGFVPDGSGNVFLASGSALLKFDPNGKLVWSKGSGPTFGMGLTGAAVVNGTNIFVSGSIPSGTTKLDGVTLTSAGSDDAAVARLMIDLTLPPVITVQPKTQTVFMGDNVTFSITATGAEPLRYQWYFGNLMLTSATNATLNLTNVNGLAMGIYYAVVSNAGGSTTSAVAQLSVNTRPPTITQQPLSQTVDLGADVQFTVAATGAQPFFYQWRLRGTNIPNQVTSLLVVRGVRAIDGGPYTVVVGNYGGYTTSVVATLTVRLIAPTITVQPRDVTTQEGATVTFSVGASGSAPLTYRWQRNGIDVPNGNSSTLTLIGVKDTDIGTYTVIVSNAANSVTSAPAKLSILQPVLTGEPFTWNSLMANACGGAVSALSTDQGGNIYLAATQPNIPVPGLTNASGCGYGFAIAKLDADGRGIWRNLAWGTATLSANVVSVQPDNEGNLIALGTFTGSMTFGPFLGAGVTVNSAGKTALFVAKFGVNGALVWVKTALPALPSDLVVDALGNCYIAGTLPGSGSTTPIQSTFGTITVSTANARPFVAKADPAGNFLWVRTAGAKTTWGTTSSLALDPSGDLWLAGRFYGTLEYGTNLLTSAFPPPNNLSQRVSAFLTRLDGEGQPRWSRMYQARFQVGAVYRVGPHPAGGALISLANSGAIDYPPVTTPENGTTLMRVGPDGTPLSFYFIEIPLKDIALNSSGSALLAAELPGDTFGGFKLSRPNGQNIAGMLKLKPDLTPELARSVSGLKGTEYASPSRLALSPRGDALIAGMFYGTNVVFGPLVSHSTFSGSFLAKLGTPALPAIAAHFSAGKITLTWPANGGWLLERVQTLGGTFVPFTVQSRTNSTDSSVVVELPIEQNTSFFRLRQP